MVVTAEGTFFQDPARRADQFVRAYSSIGQSPRLITGPFLVRIQVGPLLVTAVTTPKVLPAGGRSHTSESVRRAPSARVVVENAALSPLHGAS